MNETPTCVDCGKELSEADLASTDPRRCDSCEQQASYDEASALHVLHVPIEDESELASLRAEYADHCRDADEDGTVPAHPSQRAVWEALIGAGFMERDERDGWV